MKKMRKIQAAALVTASMLCMGSAFSAGAQQHTQQAALQFGADGKFTILVLTDIHETAAPLADTMDHIREALDTANPDLVVLGGDNVVGAWEDMNEDLPHEQNVEQVQAAIRQIVAPIVERKLSFAVIFGNHDHETGVTREEQMAMYQQYPGCLAVDEGPELPGCGTYNLTVRGSSGDREVCNLYFIDSGSSVTHEQIADGIPAGYQAVTKEQISWYEAKSGELRELNGGQPMPSLLFQHIAVPEVYGLFEEVRWYTPGATRGQEDTWKHRYFKITDPGVTGSIKEGPCPPNYNTGEFESWKKQGDILGAFFGHDHKNDFCGEVDGISLACTRSAGALSYGGSKQRGARVITLEESDLTTFSTTSLHMTDTRRYRKNTAIVAGGTVGGIAAAGLLTGLLVYLVKKKRAL